LIYNNHWLEQKFVAFFSSKISIFYKISITSFDRAKFPLSESVLRYELLMELGAIKVRIPVYLTCE